MRQSPLEEALNARYRGFAPGEKGAPPETESEVVAAAAEPPAQPAEEPT